MKQINERYWKSKFARFVKAYGVDELAVQLGVVPSAIYNWIRSAHAPKPGNAETIQRLARESGVRLTIADIYEHSREHRALGPSKIRRDLIQSAPRPKRSPDPQLWKSKFALFVRDHGVNRLASELGVAQGTIFKWIRGEATPRQIHAAMVQRVARETAGVTLSFDDVYGHCLEASTAESSEPQAPAAAPAGDSARILAG